MGDKAATTASPGGAKPSRARGGSGDASKRKEKSVAAAKRGSRAKQQVSESEDDGDDDDEEEEEEAEDDDEEEAEDEDASETGSESERKPPPPLKKLATRKPSPRTAAVAAVAAVAPSARKAKDDDKRKGPPPSAAVPSSIKSEKPSSVPPPSSSSSAAAAGRRRGSAPPATKDAYESDGSETTSQGATDDEMIGRPSKEKPTNASASASTGASTSASASASANANANASASTSASASASTSSAVTKDAGGAARDRERERERDSDRVRSDREPRDQRDSERSRERDTSDRYRGDRDPQRDADRERNSSMTLPSLSRAAMIHMNRSRGSGGGGGSDSGSTRADKRGSISGGATAGDDDVPMNGYSAEPSRRSTEYRRDRSRSRSRERADPRDTSRWNDSNQPRDNGRGADDTPNYPGGSAGGGGGSGGNPRDDDPMSPGQDGQDVRIMFHGREVYADDLIGLRVAKTFVGHGRFLGQVVKFDEPTSLYTIVYADGDAEELSIENTIQILIQDEIERADPSVPPVSSAFRNDRIPDSPEAGSVTPASSTATVSVPVAPMSMSAVPVPPPLQPPQQPPPPPQQQQPPVYQSRRSTVPFTEREAQFVMGMFENNALPVLLRQGWRVQSNAAGTEQRFLAPPGSFRGAGHVFLSAFDIVELIVFDNELLTACFPQNMHSVILSLFPETSSSSNTALRKRGSPAVPADRPVDGYDSKRMRGEGPGGRDGAYAGGAAVGVAPMGRGPSMGLPPGRSDERLVPPVSYRADDRDRERDRDGGYGGPPSRMAPPLTSGDRFAPPSGPGGRGEPSDGYRRQSSGGGGGGGDYRSMPLRPMASADGPTSSSTSSSRWGGGGGEPPPVTSDAGEYHHRRAYGDAPEWHDRDPMAGRGGPPPSASLSSGGYMGGGRPSSGGVHRGEEPNRGGGVYYSGDRGLPRGGPPVGRPSGPGASQGVGPAEPVSSYGRYRDSRGPGGGQYSPGPDVFSNRYPPSSGRGEPVGPDYRGPSPGGGAPPSQQGSMPDRFARPLSRGGSGNGGPLGAGPGGRGFSMMDVERNVSGSGPGAGYDHRMERGRSPHLGPDVGGGPGGSGGYMQQQQHYGHHQRSAGANGVEPNPADDSRPL